MARDSKYPTLVLWLKLEIVYDFVFSCEMTTRQKYQVSCAHWLHKITWQSCWSVFSCFCFWFLKQKSPLFFLKRQMFSKDSVESGLCYWDKQNQLCQQFCFVRPDCTCYREKGCVCMIGRWPTDGWNKARQDYMPCP